MNSANRPDPAPHPNSAADSADASDAMQPPDPEQHADQAQQSPPAAEESGTPRRMSKRAIVSTIVVFAVALLVGVVVFLIAGRPGERRLERWVGSQIRSIVNGYLNPELQFEEFRYTYPLTVQITDARLVADAPEMPGGTIDILHADRLLITLGRIPSIGDPIEIERIRLDRPTLRAVTDAPRSGRFYGYSNLVKSGPSPDADPEPTSRPVKLSQVMRLRLIRIVDGRIVYDDRTDGTEAMMLDGLSSEMRLTDPSGGWHSIHFDFGRPPLLSGALRGRLSLDQFKLDADELRLSGALSRDYDAALPPQLQQLLRQHDVTGRLDATLSGMVDFSAPQASDVTLEAALSDAFMRAGQYRLPIELFAFKARLADRKLDVAPLDVQALGGRVEGGGSVHFDTEQPTISSLVNFRDIRLENALEGTRGEGDEPLPFAGVVSGQINLQGPLAELTRHANGDGHIRLTDGRLVKIPVLSAIRNASKSVLSLGQAKKYDDEAEFIFRFAGDRIDFSEIKAETGILAVRGKGEIFFDGTLALRLNGGPLEKAQNMLGPIGKISALVTDNVGGWRVEGSITDPQVSYRLGDASPAPGQPAEPAEPAPEADPDVPMDSAIADGPADPLPYRSGSPSPTPAGGSGPDVGPTQPD